MTTETNVSLRRFCLPEIATFCLLFLMMFIPYEQPLLKMGLIVLILASVVILALRPAAVLLHMDTIVWYLVIIGTGAFFVFWGILHGRLDALRVMPVFVIYPVIFIFITGALSRMVSLDGMIGLLVNAAIFISAYTTLYILSMLGILPFEGLMLLVRESVVSVGTEFFSYAMPSITTMLFLVPFLVSAMMLWTSSDHMPVSRRRTGWALLLSFVPIIFSSTRVFWIILLIAPMLTYLFICIVYQKNARQRRRFFHANLKRMIWLLLALTVPTAIYFRTEIIDLFFGSSAFIDAATFSDRGTSVRSEQFQMLLAGWIDVPVLGAGHGASLPNYKRSFEAPWAYELSFIALLYQTGLLGVFLYGICVAWLFGTSYKLCRSNQDRALYLIPLLVAMACFLLATGTNPYLYAFDHLWTVFAPMIAINVFLLRRDRTDALSCARTGGAIDA